MDIWLRIDRPLDVGVDVPLKDEASEKVKKLYNKTSKGDLIVWFDKNDSTVGIIKNNRSISVASSKVSGLRLAQMEPAKGRGFVELVFTDQDGKDLTGIYSNLWSKKALTWLSTIQQTIAKALDLTEEQAHYGHDA